jgi:DnaK suppressor protein
MNADLKVVRQGLQSRLEEGACSRGVNDAIHAPRFADPVDMTQESTERELAVQILDRESVVARRIRSAIDRIEGGAYGICLECEEEISPRRLNALPWAELCIHCQERADELDSQRKRITAYGYSAEVA